MGSCTVRTRSSRQVSTQLVRVNFYLLLVDGNQNYATSPHFECAVTFIILHLKPYNKKIYNFEVLEQTTV
jgi:hypothetical protein